MRQEVIGIHVDCFIVILHRLTQFVAVHTHHSTIHIVVDHTRLIVDGFRKSIVGNFPVLALHVQSGQNRPRVAIIRIVLEGFVEPSRSRRRIVLIQINLRLESIGHIHIRPALHDGIQIGMSLLVFLHEIPAIGAVEPIASLVGTEDEGMLIVVEGIGELLLADTALGAGGKDFMHIGIQLDGLVEISFCSGIIVELQLTESTIIPRFIQIRLS